MKKQFVKFLLLGGVMSMFTLVSCKDDDKVVQPDPEPNEERWITVAGAKMQTDPGDGNGGTVVYSVKESDAKNPNYIIEVYDKGFPVPSNRTARLQSSEDGKVLYSIAYTGENGGEFSRYDVAGGDKFTEDARKINISQYAGTSPRWAKLFDGDKTGIAVNVTAPLANNATDNTLPYLYTRGTATVLAIDLKDVAIAGYKTYELPLSEAEEAEGHHIYRLDAPVLNKAGNKLLIGTWMRKTNPATGTNQATFERLGTKTLVLDYPSLTNPTIITSTVGHGDNTGYRSFNSFLATDGSIYQATQRDPKGSHILRINSNNEYDNSYVFSLDAALGEKDVYVDSWRYAGDGIAYALYTHEGTTQGFIARVDLNAKTATKVAIDYDESLDFGQYQGFVVNGDDVYVTVTPTGKDGNLYIFNKKTGAVTKGAKLVNKAGNHYIGAF